MCGEDSTADEGEEREGAEELEMESGGEEISDGVGHEDFMMIDEELGQHAEEEVSTIEEVNESRGIRDDIPSAAG